MYFIQLFVSELRDEVFADNCVIMNFPEFEEVVPLKQSYS
jgi:hypothetical protein